MLTVSTLLFSLLAVSATAGAASSMKKETEMEVMELSPPPGAGAAIDAKRARKRSRYLSPPYTDSERVKAVAGDGEEEEPPPDVCAADVLSALRAAALLSLDPTATQQALRFLTLYRRRSKTLADPAAPPHSLPAAGAAHNLAAARAAGSEEKNPPAATRKGNAGNPAPPPKRRRKGKSNRHFGNPVALVLDLAEDAPPLPSRDDLASTFSRFGSVIRAETAVAKGRRSARVVFATRAEAEAAADTLGAFGGCTRRLEDLPPVTLNASPPPPVPKLPLTDVRNNLRSMIRSLTSLPQQGKPATGNLVGEMRGLLAKVDRMLQGGASSALHRN